MKGREKEIRRAASILREGGVVAFPTETVYGLGADAFNVRAVARVFEIKNRPFFDPLIVHVADWVELRRLITHLPADAESLIRRFWPGPLTLVLRKKDEVPDLVTAGLPTVAVRMPKHPMALDLIRAAGCPIAAPSANPFGYVSPTTAEHVRSQLGQKVDFLLDGGPCEVGLESTILSLVDEKPTLLRPGGLTVEEIESVIGPIETSPVTEARPSSPGRLPKHYAPRTPILLDWQGKDLEAYRKKRIGLLAFRKVDKGFPFEHVEVLSSAGDLREAATRLFAAIRRLDGLNLDLIFAESVPEEGLGRAIMDRLRRASSPFEINDTKRG